MNTNTLAPVALVLLTSAAFGGPLSPPAGAITSTGKTLTQVEPRTEISAATTPGDADATPSQFKITQPGSYYLSGNITGVGGKIGIEITANDVTIDLNGFALSGVGGTLAGVRATSSVDRVTIRNGAVRGFSAEGIDLSQTLSCEITGVTVNSSGNTGFRAGNSATIKDCKAMHCGGHGFRIDSTGTLTNCQAINAGNVFAGSEGFWMEGMGNVATGCTASACDGEGFLAAAGNRIVDCIAQLNGVNGFYTAGGTITGCVATSNGVAGFHTGSNERVTDCTSTNNSADGFFIDSSCLVTGNTAAGNGSGNPAYGGYRTVGNGARLQHNHAGASTARGYQVLGADNLIVNNTATGNTGGNFNIGPGNEAGAVAVNPGTAFTNTNVFANIAH